MNDLQGHDDDSKTVKAQRIAYLISAYLRKSITPAEHDELDAWVGENDENMKIFEELTDETQMKGALDFLNDTDPNKALNKIKGQLTFVKYYSPRPIFATMRYYAAAAAIIGIIALSAFYIYKSKGVKNEEQIAAIVPQEPLDLKPGSPDKAILTLDDGSSIILDQNKDGQLAIQGSSEITKLNGQLNYSSKAIETGSAVMYNTVTTPRGGSLPLTLADGTKVWLNAASSIRFPAVFNGSERKVTITGEVYFEVAKYAPKGSKMPFIVDVKDKNTSIEVLGTHFNINAYNDESAIKTTLLEGSVKVAANDQTSLLKPGQQAQVNGNAIKTVSNIDLDYVMAWKNGYFRFSNTDLRTIMKQMSRWYDVEVEFETSVNPSYSGLLTRDIKASKLFEVLEETGGAHFKIVDGGKKIKVLP